MLNMSVAAVLAAGVVAASNVASATPFADALAIRKATGTDVEKVWGRGFGWGFGAGFLGGAIVGGALAAPYYYGGPYYYYGAPYYPPAALAPVTIRRRGTKATPVTAPAATDPTIRRPARSSVTTVYAIPARNLSQYQYT